MKRISLVLAFVAGAAVPARAQFAGMPVWNSPKGGTGITISGDYGKPNADAGKGYAFGARGALGFGNLTVGVGVSSYEPEGFSESATSVGGGVAFRVIGGTLLPVNINFQAGASTTKEITSGTSTRAKLTTVVGAVGASISLPTPGISIEPYVSPGLRYFKPEGASGETNFGFAIGANLAFGMVGVHVAYDYTKLKSSQGGGSAGIIGIGAHLALNVPGL